MHTILVVVHLFLSIGLIGLILIQHGKGADAGAAFGSGASATVFGARGSANFLSRTTGVLALAFFLTSLVLAWMAMQTARDSGLMLDVAPVEEAQPIPAPESDLPVVPETGSQVSDLPVVPVVERVAEEQKPAKADMAAGSSSSDSDEKPSEGKKTGE